MEMRYTLVIALLCALVAGCEKSPSDEMKSKVDDVKSTAKRPRILCSVDRSRPSIRPRALVRP